MEFIPILFQHCRKAWGWRTCLCWRCASFNQNKTFSLFLLYQTTHNEKHSQLEGEKDLALLLKNRSKERRDGGKSEWGMEWDRKWKAFSGFTPCDLISVIMGFMSFPSRHPHATSHVPGHTLQPVYFIHWLGDEHSTCVFVFLPVCFLTLSSSTFNIPHSKNGVLTTDYDGICRESMRLGNKIKALNSSNMLR